MDNARNPGRIGLSETTSTAPRMLIVWNWVPCFHLGAGILMRRMFADFPPDRIWALTSRQARRDAAAFDPVPCSDRQVSVPEIRIHRRWLDKLALLLNRLLIPWTVWCGVRLVRKARIDAIFTVPWDHFTVSAYLIHKITGCPLYMYVMDDPGGTRRFGGRQAMLYGFLMPRIVRTARRIWGVSDGMCEYFERTYGVECLPLLPLLDLEAFQRRAVYRPSPVDGTFHIIFTGAVYSMQVDAVRRLVRVVDREAACNGSAPKRITLTLYTSSPPGALDRMGLTGRNVRRDEVRHDDVAAALSEADVAFLPLSFDPDLRHVVETSLPSKIAEYLASGVPILAHAPSYSTVARYCREFGCGLIVDDPDEDSLRIALLRLGSDVGLREQLSAKGREAASKNHDMNRIAPAFLQQLREIGS
jgi:glycosyltransferase involved in cell wall biosynthesis